MFTKQIGNLAGMPGLPEESVTLLQDTFGNCQQPLTHYGPVTITPTMPNGATQAALTVGNYKKNGGDESYNIALRLYGSMEVNGEASPQLFAGAAVPFAGTSTQLAVWLLNGWAIADGTLGTPDLSGRYLRASGGGYTQGDTGGSLTSGAGSGNTGSTATGISVASHDPASTTDTQVTVLIADAGHSHSITTVPIDVNTSSPSGIAVTSVTTPSGSNTTGIINGTELSPGHHHTTPTFSHSVTDSGHTHTIGSHTHSVEPPYYIVTVLVYVG